MGESGNRVKNLASGKTSNAQKIQRTTIPPLKTPSKSPTIQTAVEKGKAANAGNKTMPQTPSRGLDQSIATPRKQNVPESTTRKQTSQKATASNYQVPTLESKIKEPSSPEEVAHKLLTESSVKPDNSYYDIYQSMDKVKAEDFI